MSRLRFQDDPDLLPGTMHISDFMAADFSGDDDPWEPGFPAYDAWENEGWLAQNQADDDYESPRLQLARFERRGDIDRAYQTVDAATYEPLTLVDDEGSRIGTENPPMWFVKKVHDARRPVVLRPVVGRRVPRARRSHRRSAPTRGSPASDDGDPEPGGPSRRLRRRRA